MMRKYITYLVFVITTVSFSQKLDAISYSITSDHSIENILLFKNGECFYSRAILPLDSTDFRKGTFSNIEIQELFDLINIIVAEEENYNSIDPNYIVQTDLTLKINDDFITIKNPNNSKMESIQRISKNIISLLLKSGTLNEYKAKHSFFENLKINSFHSIDDTLDITASKSFLLVQELDNSPIVDVSFDGNYKSEIDWVVYDFNYISKEMSDENEIKLNDKLISIIRTDMRYYKILLRNKKEIVFDLQYYLK